jgi:hypothetical protein
MESNMPCNHPNAWTRELDPALLRRLAEAADGFRNKKQRYFLVGGLKPGHGGSHEVHGPYEKSDELPQHLCDDIAQGKRGWFGPFEGQGPSATALLIDEMDIRVKHPNGEQEQPVMGFPAHRFDLLVWSRSAIEKFLVPYYARMYGGAYVDRLLAVYDAEPLQIIGHLPGTEYEQIDQRLRGDELVVGGLQPGVAVAVKMSGKLTPGFTMTALLPNGGERSL